MNASTLSARTLVRALLASGVRDVVVSPGSRSAPLVYAWADAEVALARSARPLHLHVRIDERDAAFTALGIAKAGRLMGVHRPVVVVTTSGSAVGNLHPAVMEAAHAHLPLVLLTADRPARLRGTGANQTLDAQYAALPEVVAAWDLPVPAGTSPGAPSSVGEPGEWATAAEAAVTRACTSPAGPVQLNVQFDPPLVPDAGDPAENYAAAAATSDTASATASAAVSATASAAVEQSPSTLPQVLADRIGRVFADPQARPVIVAGDDLGFATRTLGGLAAQFGIPVFPEPSSALASHSCAIPAHATVLGSVAAATAVESITHVIVTGRPTLSRPIARLLDRKDVERIDVPYDADGLMTTLGVDHHQQTQSDTHERGRWWEEWAVLARDEHPPTGIVEDAIRVLLDRPGVLVAASSNAVRHLARLQRPHDAARVVASRGLAGIDGLVATASGVALGLEAEPQPVRLLVGDLAALHDLGGFVVPRHERRPHLQIIVLNDDGGAIFAGLEHSQPHVANRFDRFFGTPHGIDLADAAQALGWDVETADVSTHGADVSTHDDAVARFRAFVSGNQPGLFQFRLPPVNGAQL